MIGDNIENKTDINEEIVRIGFDVFLNLSDPNNKTQDQIDAGKKKQEEIIVDLCNAFNFDKIEVNEHLNKGRKWPRIATEPLLRAALALASEELKQEILNIVKAILQKHNVDLNPPQPQGWLDWMLGRGAKKNPEPAVVKNPPVVEEVKEPIKSSEPVVNNNPPQEIPNNPSQVKVEPKVEIVKKEPTGTMEEPIQNPDPVVVDYSQDGNNKKLNRKAIIGIATVVVTTPVLICLMTMTIAANFGKSNFALAETALSTIKNNCSNSLYLKTEDVIKHPATHITAALIITGIVAAITALITYAATADMEKTA